METTQTYKFIKPIVRKASAYKCPFAYMFEGPKGHPLIGNYLEFFRGPLAFFSRLRDQFGDLVHFKIGSTDCFHLNNPKDVRNFLVRDHRMAEKSGIIVKAKEVLGEGLLTTEGEHHRRQRRLSQPAFSNSSVEGYGKTMPSYIHGIVSKWKEGDEINITREMNRLTLGIAGRTLFGEEIYEDSGDLNDAVTDAMEYFNPNLMMIFDLFSWIPTPRAMKMRRAKALLEKTVRGMIEKHVKEGSEGNSFLDHLIRSMTAERPLDEAMVKELRDQAMTFLLAGHETVGTALNWALYLLAQNPEVEARFHDEIDREIGNRLARPDDVRNLKYTEKIIKETLRLYPPLWALKRRVTEDYHVDGKVIPAGSTVGVSQYAVQRDPRFFPDPDRFDPERWNPEEEAKRPDYSYFPFGGGARSCIGAGMAMMEMSLALVTLARTWRFNLVPGQKVELNPLITLRPKKGIMTTLEARVPVAVEEEMPQARFASI